LGAQLRQPSSRRSNEGHLSQGFPKKPQFNSKRPSRPFSLPQVVTEVADVRQQVGSAVELLNEEFTIDRLQQTQPQVSNSAPHYLASSALTLTKQ